MNKYHLTSAEIEAEYHQLELSLLDNKHFASIYNRYYTHLFRYVIKRVKDENIAADIVSQVFLKALASLKNYKFQGLPYSSMLYKIANNEWLMYLRKSNPYEVFHIDDQDLVNFFTEMNEEVEERERMIDKMLVALKGLPYIEFQIIDLRFFENLSFREIGEILSMEEGTVKTRSYRILIKLRQLLR